MSQEQLTIRGVSVRFQLEGQQHLALDQISLSVRSGEKVLLLGPSGCGKSTLLRVIAGFQPVTNGEVLLHGRPVVKPGPDRTVVFQEFDQLFPWRTVRQNVQDALRLTKKLPEREIKERAQQALTMVGLASYLDFYPHTLSGGMKQRVAIARAWALEPEILLMDEPFAALDAQTRATLQLEVNRIWERQRRTLIFVTHSIDEAIFLGHRIVVMTASPGRISRIIDNPYAGDRDNPGTLTLRQQIRELLGAENDGQVGKVVGE